MSPQLRHRPGEGFWGTGAQRVRGQPLDTALLVKLPNRPGAIAAAAGAIGRANVNIRCVASLAGAGAVRFLTDDAPKAEAALRREGYQVERRNVVALPVSNTPGELALVAERLARANINVDATYLAATGDGEGFQVVVEVADAVMAAQVARGQALLPPP